MDVDSSGAILRCAHQPSGALYRVLRAWPRGMPDVRALFVYELIARVLDHLPAPRQQLVRYWGYYSNVSRGKRRAASLRLARVAVPDDERLSETGAVTVLAATAEEPFRRRARLTWAALIKKIYEIDPLLCPYCGAEMKIIARWRPSTGCPSRSPGTTRAIVWARHGPSFVVVEALDAIVDA